MFDRVVNLAHLNLDKFQLGAESWGQQFTEAMNVNGGDISNASVLDYVMHFVTFFWKVRWQGEGVADIFNLDQLFFFYFLKNNFHYTK